MSLHNTFKNASKFKKGQLVIIDDEYTGELLFEVTAGNWSVEVETDSGHKQETIEESHLTLFSRP